MAPRIEPLLTVKRGVAPNPYLRPGGERVRPGPRSDDTPTPDAAPRKVKRAPKLALALFLAGLVTVGLGHLFDNPSLFFTTAGFLFFAALFTALFAIFGNNAQIMNEKRFGSHPFPGGYDMESIFLYGDPSAYTNRDLS